MNENSLFVSQMMQSAQNTVIQDQSQENELRAMLVRKGLTICFITAGGSGQEGCLIYIAVSKVKNESVSYLRRQLQILHTLMVSAGTSSMIKCLRSNPNFDVQNSGSVHASLPYIQNYCQDNIWRSLSVITNLYLPLRLHPMTRGTINNIILRHK